MQTTRWSMNDNEVHPKRPGKGGSKMWLFEQRNEAIDSPTPRSEAETSRIDWAFTETTAERGTKTKPEENAGNEMGSKGRPRPIQKQGAKSAMKAKGIPRPMQKKEAKPGRGCILKARKWRGRYGG